MTIRRGEIYFVDLDPVRGREQAGRRPALVVSDDAINDQPLVVIVVVGTKASNIPKDYPTNVRVAARESGLPIDTLFLCFQIRAIDRSRFGKAAGRLQPDRMAEIDDALRRTLSL